MKSNDCGTGNNRYANGRQLLEDLVNHSFELQRKAELLLTHPGALCLAKLIADGITHTVQQDAALDDKTDLALLDVLEGTLVEYVLTQAINRREGILNQPLTRGALITILQDVDTTCTLFDAILDAEASK